MSHACRRRFASFITLLLVSLFATGIMTGKATAEEQTYALPQGFVYLTDVVPEAILEVRYYSTYNFVGERIDGYEAPVVIITDKAAQALKKVSDDVQKQGYALKVFDAYRPQPAVTHFVRWAEEPSKDTAKEWFYPEVDKRDVFKLGYVAKRSGHSRGSTVDLTLVEQKTGKEVDMGSPFDYFGEKSHSESTLVSEQQQQNRRILRDAMVRHGFKPLDTEWWHFTLADEPFPDTYHTFPVRWQR